MCQILVILGNNPTKENNQTTCKFCYLFTNHQTNSCYTFYTFTYIQRKLLFRFLLVVFALHLRRRIWSRVDDEIYVGIVARDSSHHRAVGDWPGDTVCYSHAK